MSVTITTSPVAVTLAAPYNPGLASKAKEIGGRWKPAEKRWSFAPVDEQRVRGLAREVYGTDGTDAAASDLISVRVDVSGHENYQMITLAGRIVLEKRNRDEEPRMGIDVILVSGSFRQKSGSTRYPTIGANNAVLEVRGVPRACAVADGYEGVDIIESTAVNIESLTSERLRLVLRLDEIEALLTQSEKRASSSPGSVVTAPVA
ncbi:hypothetical protein [Cryobacterium sp. GrIS_2_6]|uniref:hypothetical protein n=1 Tax=Cryobacterium sp. GrIS_2_6 TaxID=3162785 RepID=UPI002DFCCA48|nr:hypothetical protein [Cryobacterium psychrotolerans]